MSDMKNPRENYIQMLQEVRGQQNPIEKFFTGMRLLTLALADFRDVSLGNSSLREDDISPEELAQKAQTLMYEGFRDAIDARIEVVLKNRQNLVPPGERS